MLNLEDGDRCPECQGRLILIWGENEDQDELVCESCGMVQSQEPTAYTYVGDQHHFNLDWSLGTKAPSLEIINGRIAGAVWLEKKTQKKTWQ